MGIMETLIVNRENWTGKTGRIEILDDGTFKVEDIGTFRIETKVVPDPNGETDWDLIAWRVYSADGQWTPDHSLVCGSDFRRDLERRDRCAEASAVGLARTGEGAYGRQIAAARCLWNTV